MHPQCKIYEDILNPGVKTLVSTQIYHFSKNISMVLVQKFAGYAENDILRTIYRGCHGCHGNNDLFEKNILGDSLTHSRHI